MADAMPWPEIKKAYNKRLHNQHGGAGNMPARMVVGALIVKHTMNLSDEETILMIQENTFMQHLAGLTDYQTTPVFTPELLTVVRKRLGEDYFNEVTLMLKRREESGKDDGGEQNAGGYMDEDGETHAGFMKVDATCTVAKMKYPTDIGLLKYGSREVNRLTVKICVQLGLREPKTFRSQSCSVFVQYTKHKGATLMKQTSQYQIHYLKSDIETLMDNLAKVPSDRLTSILKTKDWRVLEASISMLAQQKKMLSLGVHNCSDRSDGYGISVGCFFIAFFI